VKLNNVYKNTAKPRIIKKIIKKDVDSYMGEKKSVSWRLYI
jgi:hypothetical protein